MYETGKLARVSSEMRRYNLHILFELARADGQYQAGVEPIRTGETVLCSGRDNNKHREGVAVIPRKGMGKCLIEWKPINSRLMKS